MKKLIFLAAFLVLGFGLYAQKGAYAGLNFAYNSTWLMNPQVFDDGSGQDIDPSFGHYYGLVLGYNFIDNVGLELDVNFGKIVQKYTGRLNYLGTDNYNDYNSKIIMKTVDLPLLARFGEKSYFEIGPVLQLVTSVDYTMDLENESNIFPYWYKDMIMGAGVVPNGTRDVQEQFKNKGFGLAMGFGSDIDLWEDKLALNFGVRFQYIFTDLQGVNGLGLTSESSFVPEDNQNDVNEKERFKTNPLIGGFKIGLKYRIQ